MIKVTTNAADLVESFGRRVELAEEALARVVDTCAGLTYGHAPAGRHNSSSYTRLHEYGGRVKPQGTVFETAKASEYQGRLASADGATAVIIERRLRNELRQAINEAFA